MNVLEFIEENRIGGISEFAREHGKNFRPEVLMEMLVRLYDIYQQESQQVSELKKEIGRMKLSGRRYKKENLLTIKWRSDDVEYVFNQLNIPFTEENFRVMKEHGLIGKIEDACNEGGVMAIYDLAEQLLEEGKLYENR